MRLKSPVMVTHFLQLFFNQPSNTTEVDSRWVLHVNDGFHDELCLNGQGLVLLFIHVLFIHTVNVNLLALSHCFDDSLFRQFFLLLFGIEVGSGLLLVHSLELFFEPIFILSSPDGMSLFFEVGVIHVMVEFFDFFDIFLCTGLFVGHVFLIEDEFGESFFGKILHCCWELYFEWL